MFCFNPSSQVSLEFILYLTSKFPIKQNWEETESGNLIFIGPPMAPNPSFYLFNILFKFELFIFHYCHITSLITLPRSDRIVLIPQIPIIFATQVLYFSKYTAFENAEVFLSLGQYGVVQRSRALETR